MLCELMCIATVRIINQHENAHWHNFEKEKVNNTGNNVLSGRDVQAGGTWFGVTRTGRIALLTNITEPVKTYSHSRGYLTSSFLQSDHPMPSGPLEAQVERMVPRDAQFAGFNLLLFAPSHTAQPPGEGSEESLQFDSLFVTNHGSGGTLSCRPLSKTEQLCGCVSNAIDGSDSKRWPKVEHATEEFDALLKTLPSDMSTIELAEMLFTTLSWRSPDPIIERSQLRNTVHVSPFPIFLEGVSSKSGESNLYGTRSSTVLLIKKNGDAVFIERDIWELAADGKGAVRADSGSQRIFRFQVEQTP